MQEFYNKALIKLLGLLAVSIISGYLCLTRTYLQVPLVPLNEDGLIWRINAASDAYQGGNSTIKILDDRFNLRFEFTIVKDVPHPFAAAELVFYDKNGKNTLVDLSRFSSISFSAKCSPANTLTLGFLTFDEQISKKGDYLTYRNPSAFFSCNQKWSYIELDLTRLETPHWWFEMFKLDLSKLAYTLDKVHKINIGSTFQSPLDTDSKIQLEEMTLHGRDWRYLYGFCGFMLLAWGSHLAWYFRQHTRALIKQLQEKTDQDRPLIAYQHLTIQPHKDKEKTAILRFMATEYANPELNLDLMVASTGINKNKINDILKSELGYTFITYLNKLRLTEASRLLIEEDANIAEIAFSVGYKNTSYFNKLFKEEYNCTPKIFKGLHKNS